MRLAGEVAIVTGSTSGLGADIARGFSREGACVLVTGRDIARGEAVAKDIAAGSGRVAFAAGDLTDDDTAAALVAAAVEHFGALTVLVNSAADTDERGDGTVVDVSAATWERVLGVNLLGAAFLCRAAIPEMIRAGHGSIVNISSRAAQRGTPGHVAYGASKAALESLTRSIAVDHAADGVRANTISLGFVVNERRATDAERVAPMHLTRLGTGTDVAHAAVYLASAESGFMTGATLALDGGSTSARAAQLG